MCIQAACAFQPDLVLVDKTPAGVQGELLPTFGAAMPEPNLRGIHRDFYADHVIVDGSELYLLDFDLYGYGELASSTRQNKAVIKSSVVMRLAPGWGWRRPA
jgi:hypothetical protein